MYDLSNVDQAIIDNIPKSYRKKHIIETSILNVLNTGDQIHVVNLYTKVCAEIETAPKWNVFSNHLRKLVKQGRVQKRDNNLYDGIVSEDESE